MQQPSLSSPPVSGALETVTGVHSPVNVGPVRRPYLYVGQLSQQVNEPMLKEIFSGVGPVVSAKIVADQRSLHQGSFNYGFVEYADLMTAETALQTLNGRKLFDGEIRVDWANGGVSGGHINGSNNNNIINNNTSSNTHSNISINGGIAGHHSAPIVLGNNGVLLGDHQMGPGSGPLRENTTGHFHVFVGDLSAQVNDAMLRQAFQTFASISEARVMWDVTSGKSRGYGFVAFRDKSDAEQAIATMNGEWLGSRTIRVNWANQRTQTSSYNNASNGMMQGQNRSMAVMATLGGMGALGLGTSSMPPTGGAASGTPITFEQAMAGSPPHNTTVYVGNIPPFATQNDLIPLFSHYGYIVEIRMQADRGFAFVKLDTHENAASAIVNLAGQIACGRPIKCGWGKDRNESTMLAGALRQGLQINGYGNLAPPQAMYGMPQYSFPTAGFTYPSGTAPLDATALQQMQAAQAQAVHAHAQAQAQQAQLAQQSMQHQQLQQQHQPQQ